MTKSKFDYSALKPIESGENGFDKNKLKSLDDEMPVSEEESFLGKLPRNITIGLANLGHSTLNSPHDIAKSVEGIGSYIQGLGGNFRDYLHLPRGNLKPYINTEWKISDLIPTQQEYDFASMLGQKGDGTLMDKILQKGIEHAPDIAGASTLIRSGLRAFPLTQRGAARQLRSADQLIAERGIAGLPISEQSIEEAIPFFPRTHATREMIEGSRAGDYRPSFGLQSQVGHHERNLRKSPLASERLLAPQARELKQTMLKEIGDSLRAQGHHDVADLLSGGINDYRRYIRMRENVFPVLKKIGVPTTALALLGLGYKGGRKLLGD